MRTRYSILRRLAAAGAATVVLLAAAACGDSDDGASGGPVELRFSWWGNADRARATQQVIDAFQAKYSNIKVKGETTDFNGYFDKLATEVAAGSAPDVITLGGAYPREYGDRGALLDLSKVKAQLKTDKIGEAALSNGKFSDVQYGVPSGVNAISLVLNPKLFEQAGVPIPNTDTWTWDDFKNTAKALAAKLPKGTYALADPTRTDMLDVYSRQKGEALYTKDGKVGISTATLTEWFTMTTELNAAGATPPAATTAELQSQTAPEQSLVGRGLAAMGFDWSNLIGALRKASGVPLEPRRAPGESAKPGQWLQASQIYTINRKTKHPKEAATFLDFIVNSPEAGKIILTDRGIPANSEVRDAILGGLNADQQAQVKYIDDLAPKAGPPLVIGPTGSADVFRTLDKVNVEVLFKRKTPAAGAADFIKEVKTAIGQS
jgi:multiple sugar transport system substrate-binding protein